MYLAYFSLVFSRVLHLWKMVSPYCCCIILKIFRFVNSVKATVEPKKEHIKQELENVYQQSERLTPNGMEQQTTAGNSTMTSSGQKIRS